MIPISSGLLVDWIPLIQDYSRQCISLHDEAKHAPRHSLTLLKRIISIFAKGKGLRVIGFQAADCREFYARKNERGECPVK